MYGLKERDLFFILEVMKDHAEIEEVILYGSRAMGNYKPGSDIDLALKGPDIDKKVLLQVCDALEEDYPIPYFFDVVDYKTITNQDLIDHIDREGKTIYQK